MLVCSVPIALNAILHQIGLLHILARIRESQMKAGAESIMAVLPVGRVIRRIFVRQPVKLAIKGIIQVVKGEAVEDRIDPP